MRAAERSEFLPPAEPGLMRSVGLALLAHAVLMLALSWGLKWNREDQNVSVEAELWASTVQQAAPKPQEAPPPPPPAPAPVVQPPAPDPREADIALERDRRRAAQEKARQEEAERQRQQAERRRDDQARRQELAKKAADERRREEQAKARAQQQEAERLAQIREDALKRMQGLAGATGVREATGTAVRSAGPSDSYAGRIRGRVRPNIVFTDDIAGNPSTEVEVRMAPDGTIVGTKVTRPSGVKSWDDAVVRALERTQNLPRDVDGRIHSPLLIEFRPKG